MELSCECCGRPALGVCCSSIGAYSTAYCQECLTMHAEPEWCLAYLFYDVGHEGEGLAEHVKDYTFYRDGQYHSWDFFVREQRSLLYFYKKMSEEQRDFLSKVDQVPPPIPLKNPLDLFYTEYKINEDGQKLRQVIRMMAPPPEPCIEEDSLAEFTLFEKEMSNVQSNNRS